MAVGELNTYQAATSASKLRGQYYTPDGLVERIFGALDLGPETLVLDPSCGDGSFLRGAFAEARRRFPGSEPGAWVDRIAGFDVHPEAVAEAQERLQASVRTLWGVELPRERFRVSPADVLRAGGIPELLEGVGLGAAVERPRRVVGNPPYVEAKRLDAGTKTALARRFPEALQGAPDLYLYFLHACLGWLREGDQLALVLPNKLLVSRNALALRVRLLEGRLLRGLWFATQTDAFNGAGVYPVVLFAGPGTESTETCRLRKVGEDFRCEAPAVIDPALYERTAARALFLPPDTDPGQTALGRLLDYPGGQRLADVLEIRWAVSFHRSGLRNRFVFPARPESPHARPFVGGGAFSGNGEVARYRVEWGGWWIDYDEARLRAERNPVPPAELFRRPKVAICQNGRTLRAAYEESGAILKDTLLCGLPMGEHPLGRRPRALVGLLCSRAVHFFYSHVFFGGHVNGGYLHFLRSFLDDVPVGEWTDARAAGVAERVRLRERAAGGEALDLEREIERDVEAALGLSPEETAAVAAWAAGDPNWTARERIRRPAIGKNED